MRVRTADDAWGPRGLARRKGPAPRGGEVDVLAEWLDGCDGARLGRAAWSGDAAALERVWPAWTAAAEARGFVLQRCTEAAGVTRSGRRTSPAVVVVGVGAGAPAREAAAWLEVGLSRARVAGIVARAQDALAWHAWTLDGDWRLPGHPPTMSRAAEPRPGFASGRAWPELRRRTGDGTEPRQARALEPQARVARDAERAGVGHLRRRRWRSARASLSRAARVWLAVGRGDAALRVALHLTSAHLEAGAIVAADRLAACAEVAASLVRRHRWTARVASARTARHRQAAHAHAWSATVWPAPGDGLRDGIETGSGIAAGRGGGAVDDELMEVLEAGHHEEEYPAIARVCSVVRDRLGASAVAVVALGEPTPLVGAGHAPLASDDLLRRAMSGAAEISPSSGRAGIEAAMPVRFAGSPVGVLCCRWGANTPVDCSRARTLLAAAASACAPSLHALLNRRPLRHDADETLGLLGVSAAIGRVREAIRRAAAVPFSVLVEGDSGSGKELVARAIHQASPRQRRVFCAINCAAISDELFEAEVFGHARGAFTGALADRAGLFEECDGGTLFLDEVGELSPRGQAKLLRVLQEGEVRRLGENLARRVDVRLVAATNRSLEREAAAGRFRDDLRFRLDVVRIALPPLRERREDVPLLAEYFWRQALARTGGRARLDEAALDVLVRYQWPGNVRELQNLMATLAVRAPARGRVRASDLPFRITSVAPEAHSLDEARRHFDASFVRATLAQCGGQRGEAARRLGLSRQGLAKLIARLGLDSEESPVRG